MRPGRADRPHAMTPWAGSPARAQSPCRGRLLAARVPRIAPCPPGRRAAAAASLPACHASPRARPIACSALLPARHKDGGWTSAVSALLSGRSRRSFSQPPVRMPTGLGRRRRAGRAPTSRPSLLCPGPSGLPPAGWGAHWFSSPMATCSGALWHGKCVARGRRSGHRRRSRRAAGRENGNAHRPPDRSRWASQAFRRFSVALGLTGS